MNRIFASMLGKRSLAGAPVSFRDRSMMVVGALAVVIGLLSSAGLAPCHAQALSPLRGVYTPGFSATNSGVMPGPGLTYSNTFMDYSFDRLECPNCGSLANSLDATVLVDLNVFMWVSKKRVLGGDFAVVGSFGLTNSALSLSGLGSIGGGGGFSDSYFQPFSLGWHLKRADIQAAWGVFAPTGKFSAGASDNTGSGHWTNAVTSGQTVYLTKNKLLQFSAYEMYEFHGTQDETNIKPGQTLDLDYSLTQIFPFQKGALLLQFGLAGYGQWQTTDNSGPNVNPSTPGHYSVNGIGAVANIILPARQTSVGIKYFEEFSNSNTVEGYSLQIAAGITF